MKLPHEFRPWELYAVIGALCGWAYYTGKVAALEELERELRRPRVLFVRIPGGENPLKADDPLEGTELGPRAVPE